MRLPPLLILLSILLTLTTVAGAETRVALVIGNDAYSAPLTDLNNARRDARGMAAKLEALGFETTLKLDAGRRELHRALDAFEAALRRSDVGLVYYAGHGIQTAQGSNYLIPSDAQVETEADLRAEGIAVDDVLAAMKRAANALNVIILDACRDNPLPTGRTARRGLSRVQPPDVSGLAILYSAAPGQVALDGPAGEHGIFTGELLKVLNEPGLALEEVVRKVNGAVRRRTNDAQRPWSLMSLESAFYFNAATVVPGSCDRELDLEYWRSVKDSTDPADYEAYLSACPQGQFVRLARNRLKKPLGDGAPRTGWEPGRRFRDCPACPEMVVVPAGNFEMGSPASEKGRYDSEGPQHRVTISEPFAISVHEVTRGEFGRFVRATGRSMGNTCYEWDGNQGKQVVRSGRNWRNPGFAQTDAHPVVCVSWEDARAYARWLSRETGKRYRLPSESEWEYAARARTRTARFWGESATGHCGHANGADTGSNFDEPAANCNDGHARTAPVGNYKKNGFGLHDVLGNVWEWTRDCWNDSYQDAPADGRAWERGECDLRVVRGGSWFNVPGVLRSANRVGNDAGNRDYILGFRLTRTLTP